jgi:hypothetical protein
MLTINDALRRLFSTAARLLPLRRDDPLRLPGAARAPACSGRRANASKISCIRAKRC